MKLTFGKTFMWVSFIFHITLRSGIVPRTKKGEAEEKASKTSGASEVKLK